jgi:hypothetical protein
VPKKYVAKGGKPFVAIAFKVDESLELQDDIRPLKPKSAPVRDMPEYDLDEFRPTAHPLDEDDFEERPYKAKR